MAKPSESLLDFVRRDLQPVRPLMAPMSRGLVVLGFLALIAATFLTIGGLREDFSELGARYPVLLILRIALGAVLIVAALREGIPSEALPRTVTGGLLVLTAAVLIALPMSGAPRAEGISFQLSQLRCFGAEMVIALPAFLISYWLLARAYPLRPGVAALSAGLGVGLIADAILFSHCAIDQPIHVALAHEAAVVTIAALGAVLGLFLSKNKLKIEN